MVRLKYLGKPSWATWSEGIGGGPPYLKQLALDPDVKFNPRLPSFQQQTPPASEHDSLKIRIKRESTKRELKPKLDPTPAHRVKRRFDCVEMPLLRPAWRRAWEMSLARERAQRQHARRLDRRGALPTPEASSRPSSPDLPADLAQTRTFVTISGVRLPVSPMLDTMFYWIHERHQLFLRRLQGLPPPWTDDVILQNHRFTNVSRTYDRATQFLIRNVINVGDQSHNELFFRTLLFRLFNRISTYEHLEEECGPITIANFNIERWSRSLQDLRESRTSLYTGAYQINWPDFGAETEDKPSYEKHLILIKHMLHDGMPEKIRAFRSLRAAFECIREYPSFGGFTSYQYV